MALHLVYPAPVADLYERLSGLTVPALCHVQPLVLGAVAAMSGSVLRPRHARCIRDAQTGLSRRVAQLLPRRRTLDPDPAHRSLLIRLRIWTETSIAAVSSGSWPACCTCHFVHDLSVYHNYRTALPRCWRSVSYYWKQKLKSGLLIPIISSSSVAYACTGASTPSETLRWARCWSGDPMIIYQLCRKGALTIRSTAHAIRDDPVHHRLRRACLSYIASSLYISQSIAGVDFRSGRPNRGC